MDTERGTRYKDAYGNRIGRAVRPRVVRLTG
ncbi:hypothetical protein GGR25_003667 [Kaistia hirudinis]|uniref:Uncharacterized protein n=1 Tax=Kaistia hirudinis TaxID=1293440 RepID=A0A840AQR5_9HYPH|nr:hypothetical protein [Kaistia hirudinis]